MIITTIIISIVFK